MEAVLDAVRRETFGRNNAGRLRRAGRIPAVIYGGAEGAQSLAVDPKQLLRILLTGANTLIELKLEGAATTRVLVKDYQMHPTSQAILHADLYRVAMDKVIRVTVPVHLKGDAKGVKAQGGILDFVHRELQIEVLPADIPEHVTVDVTELMLHDGIRVRDIDTGGKWKALSEPDMLLVHVVAAKTEAEPAAADAAATPTAPAEPEVIKKGKVEKDEDKE
jgi:large subunit ribosomal protein L25